MRAAFLIMALIVTASCGGVDLSSKPTLKKRQPAISLEVREKYHHLEILKAHFAASEQTLNQVVVRSLMLELEHTYPRLLQGHQNLKKSNVVDMRKNLAFLSLELTVEHLAHREAVKLSSTRSAFLGQH